MAKYRVHSRAKASAEDVRLIRQLLAERERLRKQLEALTYDAIGEKFGLSGHAVKQIGSGRSWSTLR